jgi:hypothetical protein
VILETFFKINFSEKRLFVSYDAYEYKVTTLYQCTRLSVSSRPTCFICDHSVLSLTKKQHVYLFRFSLDISDHPKLGTMLIFGEMGVRILLI